MFFHLKKYRRNPLRKWRKAAGLSTQQASREVQLPTTVLEEYESCSITKVPLNYLARLIRAYRVPPKDLVNELPRLEDLFSADL